MDTIGKMLLQAVFSFLGEFFPDLAAHYVYEKLTGKPAPAGTTPAAAAGTAAAHAGDKWHKFNERLVTNAAYQKLSSFLRRATADASVDSARIKQDLSGFDDDGLNSVIAWINEPNTTYEMFVEKFSQVSPWRERLDDFWARRKKTAITLVVIFGAFALVYALFKKRGGEKSEGSSVASSAFGCMTILALIAIAAVVALAWWKPVIVKAVLIAFLVLMAIIATVAGFKNKAGVAWAAGVIGALVLIAFVLFIGWHKHQEIAHSGNGAPPQATGTASSASSWSGTPNPPAPASYCNIDEHGNVLDKCPTGEVDKTNPHEYKLVYNKGTAYETTVLWDPAGGERKARWYNHDPLHPRICNCLVIEPGKKWKIAYVDHDGRTNYGGIEL